MKRFLTLLLLGSLLAGCGYSPGFRLPRGVQKISVPVFRNETIPFRKDIEFELSRAVKRELQLRSNARLVSEESADAVLRGAVLDFRQGVLVEGSEGTVQEVGIVVRVGLRLVRTRDQRLLLERVVEDMASFSGSAGESIEDARADAVGEIARRLVSELEPWYDERQ
ncbi:MAG: LptE family protein [Planctomycetota bacterium]|nr:LptE family protein [Planctomycetota bacterium]